MSSYSLEEYTQVKHIMSATTNDARRDWHDVIFTSREA
jgi:betaine-aldehyde dehydrogenase